MPVFPANIPIKHHVWTVTGTDAHNNPTGSWAPPVTRMIIGIQQLGDGRVDPISIEYVERTIVDLILEVPDATVYNKLDNVEVNDGTEWQTYSVQGQPVSWSDGLPWQRYAQIFGGTVHVRRVN
jgi:hypothetical protein